MPQESEVAGLISPSRRAPPPPTQPSISGTSSSSQVDTSNIDSRRNQSLYPRLFEINDNQYPHRNQENQQVNNHQPNIRLIKVEVANRFVNNLTVQIDEDNPSVPSSEDLLTIVSAAQEENNQMGPRVNPSNANEDITDGSSNGGTTVTNGTITMADFAGNLDDQPDGPIGQETTNASDGTVTTSSSSFISTNRSGDSGDQEPVDENERIRPYVSWDALNDAVSALEEEEVNLDDF